MAEAVSFKCDACARSLQVWSDGNPYYRDESGRKRYAYHPDHENLARCIGNDEPHICLSCGAEQKVDSENPILSCRKCKDEALVESINLEGQTCPFCRRGSFIRDPGFWCVS